MSISFNGTGTFLVNSSGQPAVSGTSISSTVFNALTADLATGLSTCITKDGQTTTTARIPFLFGISSTLTTDSTSISTGSIITSGGVGITKALWVGGLTNVAGAVTLQSTLAVTGAVTLSAAAQSTTYLSTSSIIYLGGTTSSEVSLRRSTTELYVRAGDDSGFAGIRVLHAVIAAGSALYLGGSTSSDTRLVRSGTETQAQLGDGSAFCGLKSLYLNSQSGLIYMAGTTSAEVLLKRSGTTLLIRKGDDSAAGGLTVGDFTATGTVNMGGASGTFLNSVTAVNGVVTGGS